MSLREEGIQFEYAVRNLLKNFKQLTDIADNAKQRERNYFEVSLSQEGMKKDTKETKIILADEKQLKAEELSLVVENAVFRVRFQLLEPGKNHLLVHFVDWKKEYELTQVEINNNFKPNLIFKGGKVK